MEKNNLLDLHHHHHHHQRSTGNRVDKFGSLAALENLADARIFGQQVQEIEGKPILDGAFEEISLHFAARLETTFASLRKKTEAKHLEPLSSESIEDYMEASQGAASVGQLKDAAKRMLNGADPMRYARAAFDQPTQQFLALQYALKQGEREGAGKQVLQALRESLAVLEFAHGRRIRADINTIGVAAGKGENPQNVAQFQSVYHSLVLGESSFAATLKKAFELFKGSDFALELKRLITALGRDLAALNPSREPVQLQVTLRDLYRYEAAVTVLPRCEALVGAYSSAKGGKNAAVH